MILDILGFFFIILIIIAIIFLIDAFLNGYL